MTRLPYRPDFAGDNRDQRAFLAWCSMWLNAARRASVPGAVLASFIDWRQLPVLTDAVQAGGWTWRNVAVWHKPGIRMQRGRFSSLAEFVVYGTNGPTVLDGIGSPQYVLACKPVDDKQHIAEKPEAVMRWVMQVVPRGALVLDPFDGPVRLCSQPRASGAHPSASTWTSATARSRPAACSRRSPGLGDGGDGGAGLS